MSSRDFFTKWCARNFFVLFSGTSEVGKNASVQLFWSWPNTEKPVTILELLLICALGKIFGLNVLTVHCFGYFCAKCHPETSTSWLVGARLFETVFGLDALDADWKSRFSLSGNICSAFNSFEKCTMVLVCENLMLSVNFLLAEARCRLRAEAYGSLVTGKARYLGHLSEWRNAEADAIFRAMIGRNLPLVSKKPEITFAAKRHVRFCATYAAGANRFLFIVLKRLLCTVVREMWLNAPLNVKWRQQLGKHGSPVLQDGFLSSFQ